MKPYPTINTFKSVFKPFTEVMLVALLTIARTSIVELPVVVTLNPVISDMERMKVAILVNEES
jgi:hypothetical protein